MNKFVDNKSGIPIYNQIYSEIKREILNGAIGEAESLPSIRNLSKDLRVSIITTKRAYEELEKEGFIYTLPGKGCFVAEKNTEIIREDNLRKIEEHMDEILKLARTISLTEEDVLEMMKTMMEAN